MKQNHLFPFRLKSLLMGSLALIVLVVLGGASAVSAQSGPTAFIKTGQLNVRSGPGPGFSVVATVSLGDEVTMVGRTSDSAWAQIVTAGGTPGWVSTLYLLSGVPFSTLPVTSQPIPWAVVVADTANIRSGPGLQFSVVSTINAGTFVNMWARSADTTWIFVSSNGNQGWLSIGVIFSGTPYGSLPTTLPNGLPTPVAQPTAVPGMPTVSPAPGGPTNPFITPTPTPLGGGMTGTASITIKITPIHIGETIPRLNVYALNIANLQWVANQFYDACAAGIFCPGEFPGTWYVTISGVPAGYYAIFAYRTDAGGFYGGYTNNPLCNGTGTNDDHSFIHVQVNDGQAVTGPWLCDQWDSFHGVVPSEPH